MHKSTTKILITCALLAALSIILTRFCTIYITNSVRISFGFIPIIVSGILFGPVSGILVGATADFVGSSFLSGFGWMPMLTVGPMIIGASAGLMRRVVMKKVTPLRMVAVIFPGMVVSSIGWTTYWLHVLYGQPLWALLSARIPLYLCITVLESIIIVILFRSRVFSVTGLWPSIPNAIQKTTDMTNSEIAR